MELIFFIYAVGHLNSYVQKCSSTSIHLSVEIWKTIWNMSWLEGSAGLPRLFYLPFSGPRGQQPLHTVAVPVLVEGCILWMHEGLTENKRGRRTLRAYRNTRRGERWKHRSCEKRESAATRRWLTEKRKKNDKKGALVRRSLRATLRKKKQKLHKKKIIKSHKITRIKSKKY